MPTRTARTSTRIYDGLRDTRRLLDWRFATALAVALIYTGWGAHVVGAAKAVHATMERHTQQLHELQYAEHLLLSHHPSDPAIRDAFAHIASLCQSLPKGPTSKRAQLESSLADLRAQLEVPGERDRARNELLAAIHAQTQLLFEQLAGLARVSAFRWRQLQYLAISAVALAALAILATLVARHRRLDAERLGLRLEGAIREADSARQEAQRANQAKSRFLATVSHELRTPMTAILGTVDLLGRTVMSSRQADYLTAIRSGGETLQCLIDDVLDLSRIEAGKLELVVEPFATNELLDALALMLGDRAERAGISLVIHSIGPIPDELLGDALRLRQILVNLLGNALKFTEQGRVELRVGPGPKGPNQLRFEVQDTGPGLEAGQLERIFQAFTQADSSLTRTHGGAGLGLAICQRLVQGMGGELKVTSELGQGSTFFFDADLPGTAPAPTPSLPGPLVLLGDGPALLAVVRQLDDWGIPHLATAEPDRATAWLDEAERGAHGTLLLAADQDRPVHLALLTWRVLRLVPFSAAGGTPEPGVAKRLVEPVRPSIVAALLDPSADRAAEPSAQPEAIMGGTRVLVVDDNEMNRLVLAEMLVTLGCRVTLASGGEQALERAADQGFDLIFMDSEMPGMDGFETTRRLRLAGSESTPILGLSGHVTPEHRRAGIEAGLDDYLAKPIQLATLQRSVLRWREGRGG